MYHYGKWHDCNTGGTAAAAASPDALLPIAGEASTNNESFFTAGCHYQLKLLWQRPHYDARCLLSCSAVLGLSRLMPAISDAEQLHEPGQHNETNRNDPEERWPVRQVDPVQEH